MIWVSFVAQSLRAAGEWQVCRRWQRLGMSARERTKETDSGALSMAAMHCWCPSTTSPLTAVITSPTERPAAKAVLPSMRDDTTAPGPCSLSMQDIPRRPRRFDNQICASQKRAPCTQRGAVRGKPRNCRAECIGALMIACAAQLLQDRRACVCHACREDAPALTSRCESDVHEG